MLFRSGERPVGPQGDCEIAANLENDVIHSLERPQWKNTDMSGPAMTTKGRALTLQNLEQRRSAARGHYIT